MGCGKEGARVWGISGEEPCTALANAAVRAARARKDPQEHWNGSKHDMYSQQDRSLVPPTLYNQGLLHDPSGIPIHPPRPFKPARNPPSLHNSSPHLTGHCHSSAHCPAVWIFYATFCNKYSNRLTSQVNTANFPIAVLEHGGPWRGYSGRLKAYHSYLLTLPLDSIAIITDTYDVILQPSCSQSDIIGAFKNQSKPILFSTEAYCWPDFSMWSLYPSPPPPPRGRSVPKSDYPYLNAGTFIGYVKDLLLFLEEAYTSDCADDQGAYTTAFLKSLQKPKSSVALDYYQDVFMTIQGTTWKDMQFGERGRVKNRKTGGEGCVIHQNGDKTNLLLERIAEGMGVESFGEGFKHAQGIGAFLGGVGG